MLPPPRRPSRQEIERQRDLRDIMSTEQRRWIRRDEKLDVKRTAEQIVFTACDIVKRRGLTVNFAAVRGTGLVGGISSHVVRAYVDQWNARANGKQSDAPLPKPLVVLSPSPASPPSPAAPQPEPSAPSAHAEPAPCAVLGGIPPHPDAPAAPEPRPTVGPTAQPTLRGRFAKTIDPPRRGWITPVESLVLATRTPLFGGMLDLRATVEQGRRAEP